MNDFRTFDLQNSGHIGEMEFRKIMQSKEGIPDEDIEEMLQGIKMIMKMMANPTQL